MVTQPPSFFDQSLEMIFYTLLFCIFIIAPISKNDFPIFHICCAIHHWSIVQRHAFSIVDTNLWNPGFPDMRSSYTFVPYS